MTNLSDDTFDRFDGLWLADLSLAELPTPCKVSGWISVLRGLGEPVRIPLMVARGGGGGATVMAVAGIHGNEFEGMAAIRHVFAELDASRLHGTFAAIPVANPFAFEARQRVAPTAVDGLNLARAFPGSVGGTPTQALAHQLLDFVSRHVGPDDLLIDFHSGSHDVAFATIVGVRDIDSGGRGAAERAARHFGIANLWRIPGSAGPLNAETSRRGIPTIGTETVGRVGCDAAGTVAFTSGLRNMLRLYDIVNEGSVSSQVPGAFRSTVDVRAPCGGLLAGAASLDQRVTAGELLGTIVDVFGRTVEPVLAPNDGILWAVRATPAVHTGELLFTLAMIDS